MNQQKKKRKRKKSNFKQLNFNCKKIKHKKIENFISNFKFESDFIIFYFEEFE